MSKPRKPRKRRTSSANGNGGGKWCWPVTRLAVYLRDEFRCLLCRANLHGADSFDVTLDHVKCRSKTGKPNHSTSNIFCCCRKCNSSRGDMPLRKFAEVLVRRLHADEISWDGPTYGAQNIVDYRVEEIMKRVRRHTRRGVKRYTALAKSLIEERRRDGDGHERSTQSGSG